MIGAYFLCISFFLSRNLSAHQKAAPADPELSAISSQLIEPLISQVILHPGCQLSAEIFEALLRRSKDAAAPIPLAVWLAGQEAA